METWEVKGKEEVGRTPGEKVGLLNRTDGYPSRLRSNQKEWVHRFPVAKLYFGKGL